MVQKGGVEMKKIMIFLSIIVLLLAGCTSLPDICIKESPVVSVTEAAGKYDISIKGNFITFDCEALGYNQTCVINKQTVSCDDDEYCKPTIINKEQVAMCIKK